ncbi:protein translocase subunit SecD [Rhabdothermincola sediminis]|uniref:protein translocase subunit SecD n=1 Tax=Rhabdothermincola sediminis TaxID=2751370 RepID=UPI001AA09D2C|nr:protein translocase subunit SecD [Rhabdothermincola sediminis]
MRRRRGLASLIVFVAVALGALGYTLAVGNSPLLGLDLQGGVSVVLQPKEQVDSDALDQTIKVIRQRVDALGVAEPEITRQGNTVLVQIPGVKDKDRAIELVGQTAELRFRPVLAQYAPTPPASEDGGTVPSDSTVPTDSTTTTPADPGSAGQQGDGSSGSSDQPATTDSSVSAPAPSSTEAGLGVRGAAPGEQAFGRQPGDGLTDTGVPTDSSPSTVVGDGAVATDGSGTVSTGEAGATSAPGLPSLPPDVCRTGVPSDQDLPDQQVVLPQCDPRTGELVAVYLLGPTLLTGDALETARATLSSQGKWVVNPVFKPGADGIDKFNAAASQCYSGGTTCPAQGGGKGRLAIVLDGRVVSAPSINEPSFSRDQIEISGDFNERTARDLATVLKYGALPVELERQQVQIVSATLGRDALTAGLWAGLVGFALVTLYMVASYRLLGVLAIVKLSLEAALLWSIISYLGENNGLALTLAGVTGLIVSIGISVDSNVVYYEHMKEDVRHGRTVRSATDKSFVSAWSTIVKADVSSLIAAGLLWWLTVGPVRGFAFYLGLSTLLDLIASYFYMRPAVGYVTRSGVAARKPRWFGLPAPEAEPGATPAVPPREKATVGT